MQMVCLIVWNLKICNFKLFKTCVGIFLEGKVQGFEKNLNFLNIYASYKDHIRFWDKIDDSGLLSLENLVIDGD